MKLSIALVVFALMPFAAVAASFNCGKAATETEKMICGDPVLSALDEDLARAYQHALANPADKEFVKEWQRAWLTAREACGAPDCLRVAYTAQVGDLKERAERAVTATKLSGKYQRYVNGKADKDTSRLMLVELSNDRVRVFGVAVWVGNAAIGAVNVGDINAIARVKANQIAFVDAENSECKFTISVMDGGLKVGEDGGTCGGHNVTFAGNYRKLGTGK